MTLILRDLAEKNTQYVMLLAASIQKSKTCHLSKVGQKFPINFPSLQPCPLLEVFQAAGRGAIKLPVGQTIVGRMVGKPVG